MLKERLTCRDQVGRVRLLKGANIMDALEKLVELEEAIWGPMMVPSACESNLGKKCRGCGHYHGPQCGEGFCDKHPARDRHGHLIGGQRNVQAARRACGDWEEARNE
jgi:hypothetical protein